MGGKALAGAELSAAFKLLGAVAKPAADRLKRQEGVVAVLHKLGLAPEVPPPDFAGVYTYTVVEYCYGKPEPVLRLFQNEYVREAFEKSFATGDLAHLDREVTEILRWNDETGALGRIDYNLAREVTGFSVVFNRLVDRTRTAAETRVERDVRDVRGGVKDIQESLSTLVKRLDRMNSREEILRQEGRDDSPAGPLANELREWFAAVEYKILTEAETNPTDFVWLVRVPARRGYETVVVLGKSGELSAPDVTRAAELVATHRAAEGWVVVPQRISKAARAADDELDQIYCYTLDELIDERADFEPYLTWLENEVRRREIDERFVPLSCVKEEPDRRTGRIAASSHYSWREGGLDDYVRSWLDDNAKEHLSILGEFGMGKSWFSLHFAWTVAQEWRAAKASGRKRPRLPLVIPLRDYAKAVSLESLFSEFFFRKHEILPDGYRVFETLNRMGRLLLIFDGFDEMAARVDRQAMINNFWELARAVVPGSKILLTCRTEHFPEAQEGRNLLSARLVASTAALTGEPPQFEVVELQPFDDEQIGQMLERITTAPTRKTVLRHQDLVDLMRRPVMADLVLSALPAIEGGAKVDISRVYLYAVQQKIDADIRAERTFTSLADKVYFLCELSWFMLSESMLSINYRAIPDHIRACFGPAVQEQRDLDHWHYDMLGQTMLVRNSEGDYSPAHRSLLEFFAAYKVAAELGLMNADFMALVGASDPTAPPSFRWSGLPTASADERARASGWLAETTERHIAMLGAEVLSDALFDLMLPMLIDDAVEPLVEMLGATSETPGFSGANLVEVIARLDPRALRGRRLDEVVLSYASLDRGDAGMDLTGCSLRGALLDGADLEDAIFTGADLTGAHITGARFLGWERNAISYIDLRAEPVLLCVSRNNKVHRWDLAERPSFAFAIDKAVEFAAFMSDGNMLAVYDDESTRSRYGAAVHDPSGARIAEVSISGDWGDVWDINGRSHLLELCRGDNNIHRFTLRDLATEELIAEVPMDSTAAAFEINAVGRCFGSKLPGLSSDDPAEIVAAEIFELVAGPGESLRYVKLRTVQLAIGDRFLLHVFGPGSVCAVLPAPDGGVRLALLDADTGDMRTVDVPPSVARSDQLSLDYPSVEREYALNRDGTIAAFPQRGRIVVLDLSEPSRPLFTLDASRHVTSFVLTRDDALVVGDAYGGLAAYDVRTGRELASANLSERMRGTILRDVTGIQPEEREFLTRNGAILD